MYVSDLYMYYVYICIHMSVCIYVYMYTYMCVCMYTQIVFKNIILLISEKIHPITVSLIFFSADNMKNKINFEVKIY